VHRERPSDTADRFAHEEEETTLRVHLHFFAVLCEWADAKLLKERLEQLLASEETEEVSVLRGISQHQRCYFMIVAPSPLPPSLVERLRALKEVHDSFDFTTTLDLGTDNDESDGEAFGV
jgi:hypothetical protein